MNSVFLFESQMKRLSPFFPCSHGVPCVDDMDVISGKQPSVEGYVGE